MTAPSSELVLCAETAALPPAWLPEAGSIPLTEPGLFAVLTHVEPHWIARSRAETDERVKQWIPYVLIEDPRGRLAAYPRHGSETRLHGCWSLGVGGHVNPQDDPSVETDRTTSWRNRIWSGLQRELQEEFPAAVRGTTEFLGLIHESRSAVGRVHLGAVFLHRPAGPPGEPGPELTGLQWLCPSEIGQAGWPLDRFELWSQLALQLRRPRPAA